jgi:peptidoglycan-associated lipoprotein
MKKIAFILAPLLVVACSATHKADSSQPLANAPVAASSAIAPATASASPAETATSKLAAELQALEKLGVYFDFDKSAVKPDFQDDIQKQAAFIKSHKNDVVTLEGNCDERGSAAYNRALGDRRAKAVKNSLKSLGVPAAQIRTVSLGKSEPRLLCHEEKCWKENRRVDFVHKLNQK